MTDRKISELPAATLPLAGTEPTVVVQGGETRRVPSSALRGKYPTGSAAGAFVAPFGLGQNNNTTSTNANTMIGSLIEIRTPITLDRLSVRTGTANTTGDQAAFAIYDTSPTRPLPTGTPLWSSPAVSMPLATTIYDVAVSPALVLVPGLYFFACNQNVTRAFFTRRGAQAQATIGSIFAGFNIFAYFFGASGASFRRDSVPFGTWPTLTGNTGDWTSLDDAFEAIPQLILRSA